MREALIAALQAEAESGKPQEVKDAGHLLFGLRQMVRLFKHLAEDKAALHDMIRRPNPIVETAEDE